MIDADQKEFSLSTRDLFISLGQNLPSKEVLIAWWQAFKGYELKELITAYDSIAELEAMPTIANVLSWLKPKDKVIHREKYPLRRDNMDWARKILNDPQSYGAKAIELAKVALKVKN